MKQKIAIVTDGACSMTLDQANQFGVHMAPIYVNIGEKTYRSGVDLEASEFYHLQRTSKKILTTAQTTTADFIELYTKLADEVDEIISIVVSCQLSATYQSAEMAQKQFTKVPVHTVDSGSVSWGQGMMAIAAVKAAALGQDAHAVIRLVENIKQRISIFFMVETLEYLRKGGRIGGAAAFLGSALDIKPILHIKDGKIESFEKQRTRKRSVARLVEIMEEKVAGRSVHVAVLHGNSPDEAAELEQQIRGKFNCVELITSEIGPVIGVHAGPGTLGLVYYSLD
ncbi:MAG: DegV family protein [Flexilinea sp.]